MNLRIPYDVCKKMTLKEIRSSEQYKKLSPFGKINKSGTYKYGYKSSANKEELCKIMDNPKAYQSKVMKNKLMGMNSSKRKRDTRKGLCLVQKRKPPCKGDYPHEGLTTTGKICCYKRKQSKKTMKKRSKN